MTTQTVAQVVELQKRLNQANIKLATLKEKYESSKKRYNESLEEMKNLGYSSVEELEEGISEDFRKAQEYINKVEELDKKITNELSGI